MSADPLGLAYPTDLGASGVRPPPPWRHVAGLLGPLVLVTPPSGLVVTLDEAKAHCRIDLSDDDADVTDKIAEATELAEREVAGERQFLTATYDVPVRGWWPGALDLPRPPLQSAAVKYYDPLGVQQTLAASCYLVATPWRAPGRIERAPGQCWPALQCDREYPVTVRMVCGYGLAAAVPRVAKAAIKLIVGHAYRYRGDDADGAPSELEIPPAAVNLLRKLEWGSYA